MRTYEAYDAKYVPFVDMLYVTMDGGDLSCCYSIEDTPSGITVMYDKSGEPSGFEIPFFNAKFGGCPASVIVDSANPFELLIERCN